MTIENFSIPISDIYNINWIENLNVKVYWKSHAPERYVFEFENQQIVTLHLIICISQNRGNKMVTKIFYEICAKIN